eukprot:PITA_24692
MIIGETLYHRGVDTDLRRCLTHEEAEKVLNDCHSGTCGGHRSSYTTTQNILRERYFWPTMFKYCITVVRSCHACQIFDRKTRIPPAPLQPVFVVGPFAKWGIYFMTCNPTLVGGHGYIIVAIDYFTKWAEAMPTLNNSGETAALFFFNHVYTLSTGVWHGSNPTGSVQNLIPQTRGRPSPGTSEEEAHLLELIQLDETYRDATLAKKAHKKRVKAQFDKNVNPRVFSEGDLVLLYDQESDKLGAGKFKSLWMGPYIVKHVLAKGAYELVDYDGVPLAQPRNRLYLKRYYA